MILNSPSPTSTTASRKSGSCQTAPGGAVSGIVWGGRRSEASGCGGVELGAGGVSVSPNESFTLEKASLPSDKIKYAEEPNAVFRLRLPAIVLPGLDVGGIKNLELAASPGTAVAIPSSVTSRPNLFLSVKLRGVRLDIPSPFCPATGH